MQFTKEHDKIFANAAKTWGLPSQESMAVGECGEFIALQGKKVQGRDTREDWISEIADVIITMEQMAILFGYSDVQKMINYKMIRLCEKLNSGGDTIE